MSRSARTPGNPLCLHSHIKAPAQVFLYEGGLPASVWDGAERPAALIPALPRNKPCIKRTLPPADKVFPVR